MRILIVDDEVNICMSLTRILEDDNYQCESAYNAKTALSKLESFEPALVFLDVRLDGANGLDVLKIIKEKYPDTIVIMISGHSGIIEAVKAIKLGAFDFLEKPLGIHKIKITIKNAIKMKNLSSDYHRLKTDFDSKYEIIGKSKPVQDLRKMILKIAPTDSKILIRGESGTGKELIAYAIHNKSKRKNNAFIKFNSAAIPNELVESELFGYEQGAFTGAIKPKSGKIELADGGTLFFDEIGDMSLDAQAKVLRVIQEGQFERVGGTKTKQINTRIIAATHKDLEKMVAEGSFREDLYYRLNVIEIISPPLRERASDIPLLIEHFIAQFNNEMNLGEKKIEPSAIKQLQNYKFTGNIRELRNLVERAYILSDENLITAEDLKPNKSAAETDNFWYETDDFKIKKKQFEKRYLQTQMNLHNNSVSHTAKALNIQVSNLSRKLKELEINK